MGETAEIGCDDARHEARARIEPTMRRFGWFWYAITAGTLLLGAIGGVSHNPSLLHSWRGALMVVLMLAYAAWFWRNMSRRRFRRGVRWPLPTVTLYAILGTGLALTAALYWVDSNFIGLVFVIIGLSAALSTVRQSLLPMVAAAALLLYAYGLPVDLAADHLVNLASGLFSLALTLGLSYSLATLIRQRYQREQLIVELQEAHRRLQLSAAQEADLAALRERNRLAREMHDSLGHALVLIAMKIEAAQRLQAIDPERAAGEWEDTKALVRSTMADLRNSLAGLRLPALEEQPFCEAMTALAEELSRRTSVQVTATLDPACAALDRPIQEALYRVAQEALANVAKHARAGHAWLTLAVRAEAAELGVADDGIGLGATLRDDGGHYGVLGMRERVEALGGVLTLGPRDGGGTLLRARVPVEYAAYAPVVR